MKSNLWSRIRAAGCCAAFSLVLFLGGCTSAASSTSTAPSSSSQALSEAPTSQVVPSGEDDTAPAPSAVHRQGKAVIETAVKIWCIPFLPLSSAFTLCEGSGGGS